MRFLCTNVEINSKIWKTSALHWFETIYAILLQISKCREVAFFGWKTAVSESFWQISCMTPWFLCKTLKWSDPFLISATSFLCKCIQIFPPVSVKKKIWYSFSFPKYVIPFFASLVNENLNPTEVCTGLTLCPWEVKWNFEVMWIGYIW